MAKQRILTTSDDYFPEFWPAKKIIGELELAVIKAEKIIGKITSEQIASLEAAKVTGQLTNAQIKEIEAAKIAGQLTSAQIESLAAAKVVGLLVSAQIESLTAVKITGLLTNAQIESLAATKITGTITETQIGPEAVTTPKLKALAVTAAKIEAEAIESAKIKALAITAVKIAAEAVETSKIKAEAITTNTLGALQVTAAKLAVGSVTAEKILANAVTAEKILAESITSVKIAAGAILTEKIGAGQVTAAKLSVIELSAITANIGKLTTGLIEGTAEFLAGEGNVLLNKEGVDLKAAGAVANKQSVTWFKEIAAGVAPVDLVGRISAIAFGTENKERELNVGTFNKEFPARGARLEFFSKDPETARIRFSVAEKGGTIYNNLRESSFIQVGSETLAPANVQTKWITFNGAGVKQRGEGITVVRTAAGKYTLTFPGSPFATIPTITVQHAGAGFSSNNVREQEKGSCKIESFRGATLEIVLEDHELMVTAIG